MNQNLIFLFVYCTFVPAENHQMPNHRQCVAVGYKPQTKVGQFNGRQMSIPGRPKTKMRETVPNFADSIAVIDKQTYYLE